MTARTLLTYKLPGARWCVQFSEVALRTLRAQVQRKPGSCESVGQLYSRDLTLDCIIIEEATVLTPTWAAWARVKFNPRCAASERLKKFVDGLHCVGLWHSHPEPLPNPSEEDKALARDHALAASGQVAGLIFAIVGSQHMPAGLRVWIDDGEGLRMANHQAKAEVLS